MEHASNGCASYFRGAPVRGGNKVNEFEDWTPEGELLAVLTMRTENRSRQNDAGDDKNTYSIPRFNLSESLNEQQRAG